MCEELWCSDSPHIPLSLDGVEIICNGSGSHTQLRKNYILADLVKCATMKCGGTFRNNLINNLFNLLQL